VNTSRTSYRLKRFTSSRDADFAAALQVYVRNTAPSIRTDTNEITYWLDEFAKKFGDSFYVFGFYRDRSLVGYAECAYFQEERLIAIDYITIDAHCRRNNVFYEFVEHLKQFLEDAHPEYRYAVAEVTYGPGQPYPSQESSLITRLLKLQGFRVIRAPYFQPRLMIDYAESEMQADLLIYSPAPFDNIQADTYLAIVQTLYYKYYLRWKSVIPNELGAYRKHLDGTFSKVQAGVGRKRLIQVNGHSALLKAPVRRPVVTVHRIISFSFQALFVITLLTGAMLGLKSAFNLPNSTFVAIYVLAISSFMAVAGIVSKEARTIFSEFVSLAKFFSRKKLSSLKPTEAEEVRSLTTDQDKR
jgi:hypothetical protein